MYCVDAVILKSIVVIIGFPVVLGIGQKHSSIYNDPQLLHCKKNRIVLTELGYLSCN